MNQSLTQQRIRITFGKFGAMRFVGHLDTVTTWERILRRAKIPLEYTRGYNPRPRLQFASALGHGLTSESECFDAWLTAPLDGDFPGEWIDRLAEKSPAGIRIYNIADVPIKAPSLPQQITSAEYVITPLDAALDLDDLRTRVEHLLAQAQIERVRRKKTYDLRPLILHMRVLADGNIHAWVKAGERENARPDELVDTLGMAFEDVRVHRRRLYFGDEPVRSQAES